jgi:hypothetical protein
LEQLQPAFKYTAELNNVVKAVDEQILNFEWQLAALKLHVPPRLV